MPAARSPAACRFPTRLSPVTTKAKQGKVLALVEPIVTALERDRNRFLEDFERQAVYHASRTLDESEGQQKAEALRYGLDWSTVEVQVADCLAGSCKYESTTYSMARESPAVAGLQAAAKILVDRKRELDQARDEMDNATAE